MWGRPPGGAAWKKTFVTMGHSCAPPFCPAEKTAGVWHCPHAQTQAFPHHHPCTPPTPTHRPAGGPPRGLGTGAWTPGHQLPMGAGPFHSEEAGGCRGRHPCPRQGEVSAAGHRVTWAWGTHSSCWRPDSLPSEAGSQLRGAFSVQAGVRDEDPLGGLLTPRPAQGTGHWGQGHPSHHLQPRPAHWGASSKSRGFWMIRRRC